MAQATCQNTDCDRSEPWTLRKHPDDYANGVTCPDCGTTRVDVTGVEDRSEPRAPQRREAGGGRGTAPARSSGGGGGSMVADVLAVTDDDAPAQRKAEGAQNILQTVGESIGRFINYREQKKQAVEQRAAEVELEKASDLPQCEECDHQFIPEDIGLSAERVACPECGTVYNISQ